MLHIGLCCGTVGYGVNITVVCFGLQASTQKNLNCVNDMSEVLNESNDLTMKLFIIMELPFDRFCGYGY